MTETPDSYIERLPEDAGPNQDDACMVCDKIECECPPDIERGEPWASVALRAIAKHAGRVKNGKSGFTADQHMDAIIKLANIGLVSISIR